MNTFENIDYDEWLKKVKKELKTDDPANSTFPLTENIDFNPFFKRVQHGDFQTIREEKVWSIGEVIDLDYADNSYIIKSLEGGAQALYIINATLDTNFNALFANVYLSMIDVHLESTDIELCQNFGRYVETALTNQDTNNIYTTSCKSVNVDPILYVKNFIINTNKGLLVTFCNDVIQFINSQVEKNWTDIVNQIRIEIVVSSKGMNHVSYVEAIRQLWYLIADSFGESRELPLIVQHVYPNITISPDENFIHSTVQALFAVISTCDVLYIHSKKSESAEFTSRIHRNIQHLLQLESLMQHSAYAYKGSYVIDRMVDKLVAETWSSV